MSTRLTSWPKMSEHVAPFIMDHGILRTALLRYQGIRQSFHTHDWSCKALENVVADHMQPKEDNALTS